MLGLVLLSMRTLLLSAVDSPSRKHCCQSDKPAVSISPNPRVSVNSRRGAVPARENGVSGDWGKLCPPLPCTRTGRGSQPHSIAAGG